MKLLISEEGRRTYKIKEKAFFLWISPVKNLQIDLRKQNSKEIKCTFQLHERAHPICCFSVTKLSNSLWTHSLQHAKLPCPSLFPRVCSNSCPLSWWCCLTISSSTTLFSSGLPSFPAWGSFPVSRLFTSGGQSTGASASPSVFPVSTQGWFPLRLTGLISLLSKGPSGVFSSTTVWKHQFFGALPSLWSNSHICTKP